VIDDAQEKAEMITARAVLSSPEWDLTVQVAVPTGPTRLRQLLPLAQSFADAIVQATVQTTEQQGRKISCQPGCGACCRQLVPISETEARHIADVVSALPQARQTIVRERFAKARRQLADTELLEKLECRDQWKEGEGRSLGMQYFRQGIPCPFLEEESCSIYPDRPIACREYLVTSPPEHCAEPATDAVRGVQLPLKVWTALARFDKVLPSAQTIRWVPLILAPDWAAENPEEADPRPGPELARELFDYLTTQKTRPINV
jgi:Fe-S-cluster containining protein